MATKKTTVSSHRTRLPRMVRAAQWKNCKDGGTLMHRTETAESKPGIFYVLFVFLLCSFVGWVFETAEMSIIDHQFVGRGYLFVLQPLPHYFPALENVVLLQQLPLILGLPLIEVYGFGGVIAIFGMRGLAKRPVCLFLTGMVVLTAFELLGSYFCSLVLHKRFWDYSGRFLNFQGRICLMSALAWGVGALLAVRGLAPVSAGIYTNIKRRKRFRVLICLLAFGAVLCALCKYWWFADLLS